MSRNTRMSFMERYGWNGILPQFDTRPWGLNLTCGGRWGGGMCTCDDKGRCKAKNQVSVGFSTENPPQTHPLRVCARKGMAENRLGMDDCGLSKWCLASR